MKIKEIKIYTFDELSERAKENAREWFLSGSDESEFAWEHIQEDAKEIGLIICSLDQHRANSGRFERFAEDTAERIIKNHGDKCETYKTAKEFLEGLKGLKRDEEGELYIQEQDKAEEMETEFLDSLLEDYRIMLEREIEYQQSNEGVDENIEANGYEFTEDGERA